MTRRLTGWVITFCLLLPVAHVRAQDTHLFQEDTPIKIHFRISLKDVEQTNDSTYIEVLLDYARGDTRDTLPARIRARGDFRRKTCYFPPLKLRFKKSDTEGTLFEGHKSLKLVVPCQFGSQFDTFVLREYLCYRLCEQVYPYCLKTRLVELTINDERKKKVKTWTLQAFLTEDNDVMARRYGGEIADDIQLHPLALMDTTTVRHDFFQYMIGNTDWSSTFHHNVDILKLPGGFAPVAYDFDGAGVVDASYVEFTPQLKEMLGTENVRDRVYRGYCHDEALTQFVRREFLDRQPAVLNSIQVLMPLIRERDASSIANYLGEFFKTLEDDRLFHDRIETRCLGN